MKAADRVIEVTRLKENEDANIPLHWCIARDNIDHVRLRYLEVINEFDQFESWSNNLLLTDKPKPLNLRK